MALRMRLQQLRDRIFLAFPLRYAVQFRDAPIQIVLQLQQIPAPSRRPAGQRQLFQQFPSCRRTPQLALPLHSLVQRQMLQLVLYLPPYPDELVPVQQQLAGVALLSRVGTHSCEKRPSSNSRSTRGSLVEVEGIGALGPRVPIRPGFATWVEQNRSPQKPHEIMENLPEGRPGDPGMDGEAEQENRPRAGTQPGRSDPED